LPQNKLIWGVVAVHVSKQKVQKGGCFWCWWSFFNWISWRIPFRKMHMVIYVSIAILDIKWEILKFKFLSFASNFNSVLLKMIQLSVLLIGHKKDALFRKGSPCWLAVIISYHAAHSVSLYFIFFCVLNLWDIFTYSWLYKNTCITKRTYMYLF